MSALPNLSDLRATLAEAAAVTAELPAHLAAFVAWLQRDTEAASATAAAARQPTGAARTPHHAAALGFTGDLLGLSPEDSATVRMDLERLASRQYFAPGRPRSLERDAVALLGLSLAVRASEEADSAWLKILLPECLRAAENDPWDKSLLLTAMKIVGAATPVAGAALMLPELRVAFAARGLEDGYGDAGEAAWSAIISLSGVRGNAPRAAVLLTAFDRIMADALPARLARVEVEDVCRVLQGVSRSMRRWVWESEGRTPRSTPACWDVENEYHVQSLLWAILAPLFPDLEDEEWLASVGQKHPRADLAVPSLGLIIEVKFLRKGEKPGKVIDEVAADTGLYLRDGGPWKCMAVLVWDDSQRTEEHDELKHGLLRLRGVVDAVVISRPQAMTRHPDALSTMPKSRRSPPSTR